MLDKLDQIVYVETRIGGDESPSMNLNNYLLEGFGQGRGFFIGIKLKSGESFKLLPFCLESAVDMLILPEFVFVVFCAEFPPFYALFNFLFVLEFKPLLLILLT